MDAKFLKVVILAMDADGEFQQEEQDMLKQIIKAHPEFKGITNEDGIEVMGELYNKLSVGMERKHPHLQGAPRLSEGPAENVLRAFGFHALLCKKSTQ